MASWSYIPKIVRSSIPRSAPLIREHVSPIYTCIPCIRLSPARVSHTRYTGSLNPSLQFSDRTMTAPSGNIFRFTGPLWGESAGHRWITLTKASDAELSFYDLWLNKRLSKQSRRAMLVNVITTPSATAVMWTCYLVTAVSVYASLHHLRIWWCTHA